MDAPTVLDDKETSEEENSLLHIEDPEYYCAECRTRKKHYVQILDMDRFVNGLKGWD